MGEVRQIKFHKLHHRSIRVLLALALCMALPGFAASNSMPQLSVHASLSSPAYPIVVRGSEIPSLLGTSTTKIRAIVRHGAMLEAIPFQIDKRDSQGRYELSSNAMGTLLDANDECVFMSADAGERIALLPEPYTQQPVTELAIVDPHSGEQKWIYLIETKAAQSPPSANTLYVVYDATKDVIETGIYRIGFSSALPFLINSMQWHIDGPKKWSPNLVDTMKIRHHGKLFGNIDFARTQDDYRSRLVAVKEGPVRIIRRTLNTVRIFGYLQSPSLTIDFLAYRNGFQMDTTVDLPFRLNWFFSDVSTFTTIDWNDDPSLPALRIYDADVRRGLTIDGHMTPEKEQLNTSTAQRFAIESSYGLIFVQLELEKNLPVKARIYLQDDRSRVDAPENIPGQFGNIGFLTTGWEKVDTSIHHLLFNVLLLQNATVAQGHEMLGRYPWKKPLETPQ